MVPASCMCSSCNSRAFLEFSPSKCSDWAAYLAKSWRNGVTNRSSSSNCDFQWSKVLRVLASLASSSSFSSRLKYWGQIREFQEHLDWILGFFHFLYWIIKKNSGYQSILRSIEAKICPEFSLTVSEEHSCWLFLVRPPFDILTTRQAAVEPFDWLIQLAFGYLELSSNNFIEKYFQKW